MNTPDLRRRAPHLGTEAATLWGWLDFYRDTIRWKADGLSDVQARKSTVPPSSLTVVGIVKQVTEVERWWFRRLVLGEDLSLLYASEDAPEQSIEASQDDSLGEVLIQHRSEMEYVDEHVRPLPLERRVQHPRGDDTQLRWVTEHVSHMYARYCGHVDLIRERIDGQVGF